MEEAGGGEGELQRSNLIGWWSPKSLKGHLSHKSFDESRSHAHLNANTMKNANTMGSTQIYKENTAKLYVATSIVWFCLVFYITWIASTVLKSSRSYENEKNWKMKKPTKEVRGAHHCEKCSFEQKKAKTTYQIPLINWHVNRVKKTQSEFSTRNNLRGINDCCRCCCVQHDSSQDTLFDGIFARLHDEAAASCTVDAAPQHNKMFSF